jgi:hypothetical protein
MPSTISSILSPSESSWWFWAILWISTAALVVIILLPSTFDRRLKVRCDQVFETLMATKDMVELERSKYLLDKGGCSVSDRMAAE